MTWPEFLAGKYTPSTAAAYAFEVERYLSWLGGETEALSADYAKIVTYLATLRKRYDKPSTLSRILSAVKAYHAYLLETSQREDHPAIGLKLRDRNRRNSAQVQDLLTAEELARLRVQRKERYQVVAGRNAVIIGLLTYQALTVKEISRLEVKDIDLATGQLKVAATQQTNGRELQLVTPQVMQLHTYLTGDRPQLLKVATERLIITTRGAPENGDGIRYLVETLRPEIKGKRLTPTVIRQSVIALRLKKGEGLRQVQAFAGHKWVSTTEGYRENNLAELRAAVERFHPLDNSDKT